MCPTVRMNDLLPVEDLFFDNRAGSSHGMYANDITYHVKLGWIGGEVTWKSLVNTLEDLIAAQQWDKNSLTVKAHPFLGLRQNTCIPIPA